MSMRKKSRKSGRVLASKVGLIHSGSDDARQLHAKQIKALEEGLKFGAEANVTLDRNYADDKPDELTRLARNLANSVDVTVLIAAGGSESARRAQAESTTKSIVFTSVATKNRPANNMTGICARTSELDSTRLEKLVKLMPGSATIGALTNPKRSNFSTQWVELQRTATRLNVTVPQVDVIPPPNAAPREIEDTIEQAINSFVAGNVKPLLVTADPLFNNHRDKIGEITLRKKIPAIFQWREFAEAGGLMSYGPNLAVAYKLAGYYAGRIFKGGILPSDLDVLELASFDLVINLKTAKELGVRIPPDLLASADDVLFS